jgi:dipeptidyl aminopeptidase/acylaminoacyl peptidase
MVDLRALLEMRQASPLSFSSDGSRLLVASDVPGTKQLFVVEDGSLRRLTDFPEPVSGQFLPDGRVLVEMDAGGNERTQLYVLDGGDLEPLVVDERYIHRTPVAAGRRLAYVTNRGNGIDFEAVVRDLETGEETTLAVEPGYLDIAGISPDGARVVVERTGERAGDNDLYLCDVAGGAVVHVTPHNEPAESWGPVFVSDGIVFASNIERDTLALVHSERGVVQTSRWDLECVGDDAGRSVLVVANEDGYSRLTLLDPETFAAREEVPLPGRGVVEHPTFSPDGSLLAFAFSSPRGPHDVYRYDLDARELTRLTESPSEVDVSTLVEPELHRYESFDGESIPVFLFRPEGEGPFPVVVTVHGGPEGQWRPWFSPSFLPLTQYLVARGYAVAAPNVRGSTGYGKRFEHLDDVTRRLDSVRDLAALHGWLDARPEVDGSRAVLYGRSYGGYMVLAGLALQPDLWAAGLEMVGISSLVTFLENTSDYRRAAREREYGSLAADRDFLVEASPITHVDAIRAPLFIQHGANDPRVPLSESQHIHRVLTEKGIPCELVVYEDEGHTIEKLANRIDCFTRAVAFLDRVLAA